MTHDKVSEVKVERMKPSLFLNEKELPNIKKWQAGKEYDLIIRVKMTRLSSEIESLELGKTLKKPTTSATFEVLSVDAPGGTKALNESDFEDNKLRRLAQKANE